MRSESLFYRGGVGGGRQLFLLSFDFPSPLSMLSWLEQQHASSPLLPQSLKKEIIL